MADRALPEDAPEFAPHPPARRHLRAVPDPARQPRQTGQRGQSIPNCRPDDRDDVAGATVAVLRPPLPDSVPLRLTRRGVAVVSLLVVALGAALVWIAAASAPSDAAGSAAQGRTSAAVVTVHAGDTLWTIAGRTAPGADPRAEVDRLRTLNRLGGVDGVDLVPGQQLRVR